jgi:hypothetical protein
VIELKEEHERHAFNSTRINSEFVLNETDETDRQFEKHDEQKI